MNVFPVHTCIIHSASILVTSLGWFRCLSLLLERGTVNRSRIEYGPWVVYWISVMLFSEDLEWNDATGINIFQGTQLVLIKRDSVGPQPFCEKPMYVFGAHPFMSSVELPAYLPSTSVTIPTMFFDEARIMEYVRMQEINSGTVDIGSAKWTALFSDKTLSVSSIFSPLCWVGHTHTLHQRRDSDTFFWPYTVRIKKGSCDECCQIGESW